MNQKPSALKMALAALFLSLAYVLPFLTGQIQQFGTMLCPMHIPVLLCGFLCGWPWGLAVGTLAPLLRSVTLGMPHLFPNAICMAAELAAYGVVSAVMHRSLPCRKGYIYVSLLTAMVVGRLVWGGAMWLCLGMSGGAFTLAAFFAGAVGNALPGIALQIALIPPLVISIQGLYEKKGTLR